MGDLLRLSPDKAETHMRVLEELEECRPVSTLAIWTMADNQVVDSTIAPISEVEVEGVVSLSATPKPYSASSYVAKAVWEEQKASKIYSRKCHDRVPAGDDLEPQDLAVERSQRVERGKRRLKLRRWRDRCR
jgi:hypothetical protein